MPVSAEYVKKKETYDENFWSVYGRLTAEIDHALVNNIKAGRLEFDFSANAMNKIGRDIPYFFDEENSKQVELLKSKIEKEYDNAGWKVEFSKIGENENIIFSYKPEKNEE